MNSIRPDEISSIIKKELEKLNLEQNIEDAGIILQIGDGIATIHGLEKVRSGEIVEFHTGTKGIVLNIEENYIGVILLGTYNNIKEGDIVKRTKNIAYVKISDAVLGRVINTMGDPIDGKGIIEGELMKMPLERKAPEVIFRQPVQTPLQTGIKAIDSMVPVGRGQRELIIGDRQTGKTTVAIDTIINQRSLYEAGNPVYCIYVAIGQKDSTIAGVVADLEKHEALDYTIIVNAGSSEPASLQYLAPFAGAAIGEYFRDTGRHALVIYDDLSKQAVAYREISLLLRRPPGREAYPGDIFYLHARLLERAAKIIENDEIAQKMNDIPKCMEGNVKGGGSLTALPIIETQANDVSAYIPTNVISITDGQIFLESNLFNSGIRPAINVGISVSRVGGSAQIKSMKKIAGTLKLNQAQFRELEAFSRFGSDLDPVTQKVIDRGRINQEVLKQDRYSPMPVECQVVIIYLSSNGYLDNIDLDKIRDFEKTLLNILESKHKNILLKVAAGDFDDSVINVIVKEAKNLANTYVQETS